MRRGTHRVLPGYSRGTVVAPREATLSSPSHCACRTATGRERPQAQHHAAARGAAGGPVPCYVQYPAVPYRVSTTVLGATREWRNKPEASRSMGGHRLPCPYKLAATCPPSLPHPQPRQLAESESDTQTSWRGRRHTQIFERAHTARLQQRRRSLPASLPSACHMIRVELARRPPAGGSRSAGAV